MAGINFCLNFIRKPSRLLSSSTAKKNRKANASRALLRKFLLIDVYLLKLCLELMGWFTSAFPLIVGRVKLDFGCLGHPLLLRIQLYFFYIPEYNWRD